jgi:hypothetical protein
MNRAIALCATGVAALVLVVAAPEAFATVRVPALIGDHMMVQRGRPIRLWGTAAPGESVRAALAGGKTTTQADASGHWTLTLPAVAAGGPFVLTIEGSNALTFSDLWYQGESNASRAQQYRTLFPTLITAWRAAWRDPSLPFIFVQLSSYEEPGPAEPLGVSAWAELREAQAMTLRLPKTAMAVTLDIGEHSDIHPHNKREVGRRLALQALKLVYGKEVLASGPVFHKMVREAGAIRVSFANAKSGLLTVDGASPKGFMLAGADHVWQWADARIDGDSVIVARPEVREPVAVRYGWANDPPNTLRNQADLPAAPFRTDDWPARSSASRPQ